MAKSSKRPVQRRQTGPPGTPIPRRKKPSPSGHTLDPGQRRAATKGDEFKKAIESWGRRKPKPPFLDKQGRYNRSPSDRFALVRDGTRKKR